MSDEWPSKAEQEGLHNHGGGFQSPASGRFAFPEGWTDGDSGLYAYERRVQEEEAEEARKRQEEAEDSGMSTTDYPQGTHDTPRLEAESLAVKVRDLESTLEVERTRREAAEQRSADLTQSLADLREVIAKLPKALEAPAPRRRWFGKK